MLQLAFPPFTACLWHPCQYPSLWTGMVVVLAKRSLTQTTLAVHLLQSGQCQLIGASASYILNAGTTVWFVWCSLLHALCANICRLPAVVSGGAGQGLTILLGRISAILQLQLQQLQAATTHHQQPQGQPQPQLQLRQHSIRSGSEPPAKQPRLAAPPLPAAAASAAAAAAAGGSTSSSSSSSGPNRLAAQLLELLLTAYNAAGMAAASSSAPGGAADSAFAWRLPFVKVVLQEQPALHGPLLCYLLGRLRGTSWPTEEDGTAQV